MAGKGGLRRILRGLSEPSFRARFGEEATCRQAPFALRRRDGLIRPACGGRSFRALGTRQVFPCDRCKKQLRLTAGTVFDNTKLPPTTWFPAIHHLTRSKGGIGSIEPGRRLGVKRPTALRGLPAAPASWIGSIVR